jgi:hypothetical protein
VAEFKYHQFSLSRFERIELPPTKKKRNRWKKKKKKCPGPPGSFLECKIASKRKREIFFFLNRVGEAWKKNGDLHPFLYHYPAGF